MQSQKNQNKGVVLNLPASITVSNNSSLIQKLIKIVNSGYEKIVLDFSAVETIDLSSLQIILSFYKDALSKMINISFIDLKNDNLIKQLKNCGFIMENEANDFIFFPFIEGKGVKVGYR